MKTMVTAMFAALLCATVSAADPPPPPAATPTLELRASGLSVPQVAFVGSMDELQSIRAENTDERLSAYVGDTAWIRTWLGQMLQNNQAILVFDTQGRIQSERAWQFEIPSQEMRIEFPRLDDSGSIASDVVSGVKSGPRLEITPIEAETLLLDVSYRPAAFYSDQSQAHTEESQHLFHSGRLSVPNGQSLVLLTNTDLDPVPLVVISAQDADELVTIHGNWPVPYTATVPRSAAEANPLAEITSADTTQSAALAQTEPDPSYYLEDDVQYFPAGPEFIPADSVEPASSNPPPDIVADVTESASEPEPQPAAPPVDGDVRFYPGVGPARLTEDGNLVVVDESEPQPDVSIAGRHIKLTLGEPQTIEMHEHEARRVELERRIRSASGFNPDIVEVVPSGTHGLYIQSSRAGATRLTIVDENDESLELTVIVTRDVTDLELLLERLYPDADVEVIPIQNTVLLRGNVDDPNEVQQIEEIAEQFAPTVLNQLRVADDSVSSTIPSGFRVCTVEVNGSVDDLEAGVLVDVTVDYREEFNVDEPVFETLLTSVEVFSVHPRMTNRAPTSGQLVSLLLRPEEMNFVKLAESLLQWRPVPWFINTPNTLVFRVPGRGYCQPEIPTQLMSPNPPSHSHSRIPLRTLKPSGRTSAHCTTTYDD